MDESLVQRDPEKQDADAPLTRDQASWYARALGEEWESVEPGIYRHLGAAASDAEGASEGQLSDQDR
jgi:hypothetical protein